jgi:hypothetical protein
MERAEQQLPTFARASQNMAATTSLLDTLPIPSTDGVGELYQQLVNILGIAATQQAESSLQHQVEASVLTPDLSKAGGKRPPKGLWRREWFPRWHESQPTTTWAAHVIGRNLRYDDGTTQGTMTCSPHDACETHAVEVTMIMKDASSVLKGLTQRRFEAPYVTLVS